uniref:SGNH hydrolase-type esterase domain-containing protein n=1 Tax=Oreochromis aureus TaxID=47969 RepID=A0AAZ1XYZ3_OREAU
MAFFHVLRIVSVRHIFLQKKVDLLEKNITASLDRFHGNCIHTKRFSIFQSPDGCLHLCQGRLIIGPLGPLVLRWVAALLVVLVAPSSTVTAQLMIVQRCHQPFRCCRLLIWFFYSGIGAFDKSCGTHALRPLPPSHSEVRSENLLKSKRPQGKLKARPETLILGDSAVKDVQRMCGKNTKVLCFPKDMVNNLKERILQIADEYPTVTNIVLHTGSNDVSKQHGPVPPVRGGDERFSRLFALNKWLISACTDHSVHFINNFNIFWERRHLFKANGFNFNKSGVKLFTSNLFYSILTVELFSSRQPS